MTDSRRLLDFYVPPGDDLALESLVATTYKIDWEFVEEEFLAVALGLRSPVSRMAAFRSELERRLDSCDVTILYDLRASDRLARLSPRIDPLPLSRRKLHAKVTLLLWSGPQQEDGTIRRRARVIVGSANLTRQGFRENYEVVSAVDFGGRETPPTRLLLTAVDMIADIGKETPSKRLDAQLAAFRRFARSIGQGQATDDQPLQLVSADTAVAEMQKAWRRLGEDAPQAVILVSPFWPEGDRPAEPLAALVRRFGDPERVELVCESVLDAKGRSQLPLLPSGIPSGLRAALACPVLIRPSTGTYDVTDDQVENEAGEVTEDQRVTVGMEATVPTRRALHAKVVVVHGRRHSVLYIGSSNCTRRGFALADASTPTFSNWEAGFVYRLSGRRASIIDQLLSFAGPAIEVPADGKVATQEPERDPETPAPTFLREVVAGGTRIEIRFREGEAVPRDLVILMPDRANSEHRFLLVRATPEEPVGSSLEIALEECPRVDETLASLPSESRTVGVVNVSASVEVRWDGHTVEFPVRFDDRTALPPVPGMRRLTEAELIEYFLSGREPWMTDGPNGDASTGPPGPESMSSDVVDTRRILSYFVRRFVEAIPGMDAELQRSLHSRPALEASLFGPTSPVALIERAVESLRLGPPGGEPKKTPMSVAFQIVETIGVLRRCRERASTVEAKEALDRAAGRCRLLLSGLEAEHEALRDRTFTEYRRLLAGAV